jgi:hypothetical protein
MAAFNTVLEFPNKLEQVVCCECGVMYAIPALLRQQKLKDHSNFYCPNGHKQYYAGQTEEDRLRKELEAKQAELDRKQRLLMEQLELRTAAERSAIAYKAQTTKLKNRILRGVCPFCNRHFDNLERHMKTKHAEEKETCDHPTE